MAQIIAEQNLRQRGVYVGVMAQNTAAASGEKHVWSAGDQKI